MLTTRDPNLNCSVSEVIPVATIKMNKILKIPIAKNGAILKSVHLGTAFNNTRHCIPSF